MGLELSGAVSLAEEGLGMFFRPQVAKSFVTTPTNIAVFQCWGALSIGFKEVLR